MKYHAAVSLSGKAHYFWNYSKDDILTELVVPYITKQATLVTKGRTKCLLSFGSASYLVIAKTGESLKKNGKSAPAEVGQQSFWEQNGCTEELLNDYRIMTAHSPTVKTLLQRVFAPPQNRAFVIMKFGDKSLNSAYKRVIVPVVARFGIEAYRVDKEQNSGVITDQILNNIASSRLIIADLTGARPNCYYETGFAQALGKEVILLIRQGETVHFDLQSNRFIEWSTEDDLEEHLAVRLASLNTQWEAASGKQVL